MGCCAPAPSRNGDAGHGRGSALVLALAFGAGRHLRASASRQDVAALQATVSQPYRSIALDVPALAAKPRASHRLRVSRADQRAARARIRPGKDRDRRQLASHERRRFRDGVHGRPARVRRTQLHGSGHRRDGQHLPCGPKDRHYTRSRVTSPAPHSTGSSKRWQTDAPSSSGARLGSPIRAIPIRSNAQTAERSGCMRTATAS